MLKYDVSASLNLQVRIVYNSYSYSQRLMWIRAGEVETTLSGSLYLLKFWFWVLAVKVTVKRLCEFIQKKLKLHYAICYILLEIPYSTL